MPGRKPLPRAVPVVEIVQESAQWRALADAEIIVRDAIAAAAELCGDVPVACEVAVMLSDDAAIRTLNAQWRSIDRPTNVLSFPADASASPEDGPRMLGDIVIAYEYMKREAALEDKPLAAHLAHLTVHGFLHLLGYDHMTDEEAELMEGLETRILATMGIADPYGNPAAARAIHRE